jgi:hypothetical protein
MKVDETDVSRMVEGGGAYEMRTKVWSVNLKERYNLRGLGVDGRMLK